MSSPQQQQQQQGQFRPNFFEPRETEKAEVDSDSSWDEAECKPDFCPLCEQRDPAKLDEVFAPRLDVLRFWCKVRARTALSDAIAF